MNEPVVSTQHEPLLALEHLHVRFGDTVAVDDVTLAIGRGERVALVGESAGQERDRAVDPAAVARRRCERRDPLRRQDRRPRASARCAGCAARTSR